MFAAQVVVLGEEAVEAVLDGELFAQGGDGPGGQLAAELGGAFDERDIEATGGQLGGGATAWVSMTDESRRDRGTEADDG